VAFLALLLEQGRDVLAERHRWRVGAGDASSHDAEEAEGEKEPRTHSAC